MPCFKLGIRFGRPDIVKRFLRSGRTGFYLAVTREGEVGAGDAVAPIARHELAISVAEIVGLYSADAANQNLLRKASELSALPEGWRDYFRKRLWEPDAGSGKGTGAARSVPSHLRILRLREAHLHRPQPPLAAEPEVGHEIELLAALLHVGLQLVL